jgi:hypothetical protein
MDKVNVQKDKKQRSNEAVKRRGAEHKKLEEELKEL